MERRQLLKTSLAFLGTTTLVSLVYPASKFLIPPKSNAKDAKQAEQRLPTLELDARNAETLVKNMKKIDDMMKALGEGMKIEFRVYYDADSTEVVLLKSGS